MTKLLVDIDEDSLDAAAELYGTRTKKDTVNTALAEAARRLQRVQALAKARELAATGTIDVDVLLDKKQYRR
jgi:Arc/MetJ family transcription regulator